MGTYWKSGNPPYPRLCLTNPRGRYSRLRQPGLRCSSSPYLRTVPEPHDFAPCPAASAASSRRAGIRETEPNPLPQGERDGRERRRGWIGPGTIQLPRELTIEELTTRRTDGSNRNAQIADPCLARFR